MTLHNLLENNLLTDKDKIRVVKPLQGNIVDMREGFWFNDNILDFHNQEITEFSWSKERGWLIAIAASDSKEERNE